MSSWKITMGVLDAVAILALLGWIGDLIAKHSTWIFDPLHLIVEICVAVITGCLLLIGMALYE